MNFATIVDSLKSESQKTTSLAPSGAPGRAHESASTRASDEATAANAIGAAEARAQVGDRTSSRSSTDPWAKPRRTS
jgi:hypothetical protein